MAQGAAAVYYIIAAVASATATLASAHQGKLNSEAAARESENAAKQAANNALLAQRDADTEKDKINSERRRALASGVVAAGASGIQLSGSFSDSQFDTALSYERQITDTQYKADMESYNYRNQASSLMASAANSRAAGKAQWRIALLAASGELAQGVAAGYSSKASVQRSQAVTSAGASGTWKGIPYKATRSTVYTGGFKSY